MKKQISRELMLALTQVVSKYEYNPVREGDSWLKETTIKMQWMLPFVKQLALNAGICNLFDDKFQFYPGQDSIGRSVYSSLTYNW